MSELAVPGGDQAEAGPCLAGLIEGVQPQVGARAASLLRPLPILKFRVMAGRDLGWLSRKSSSGPRAARRPREGERAVCRFRQGSFTRRKCPGQGTPETVGSGGRPMCSGNETRASGQDEDQGARGASARQQGLCASWATLRREERDRPGRTGDHGPRRAGRENAQQEGVGAAPWRTPDDHQFSRHLLHTSLFKRATIWTIWESKSTLSGGRGKVNKIEKEATSDGTAWL